MKKGVVALRPSNPWIRSNGANVYFRCIMRRFSVDRNDLYQKLLQDNTELEIN